ncbi:hypothetical protein P7C70_g8720, partial [Phenoliferia sp. Uapishka_3]
PTRDLSPHPSKLTPHRQPQRQQRNHSHYELQQPFSYSAPLPAYGQPFSRSIPSEPPRPRSAPSSPELGGGAFAFSNGYQDNAYAAPPSAYMPSQRRRRGSSMDGFPLPGRVIHSPENMPYPPIPQSQNQNHPTTPTRRNFARIPQSAPNPGRRGSPAAGPTRARKMGKPAAPMFINFTSTDASAILSGVAPSGSSKRKREEEEEERNRRASPMA